MNNEGNVNLDLVAFENKVMAMARMLYPYLSCYSADVLSPIRKQLKDVEAKLRVQPEVKVEPKVEPKVEEKVEEKVAPVSAPPAAEEKERVYDTPKRRGRPPKR